MGEVLEMINPETGDQADRPVIVVSAAKAFVAFQAKDKGTKLRLSQEAIERLGEQVRKQLALAAETALEDGRRTVLARDLALK